MDLVTSIVRALSLITGRRTLILYSTGTVCSKGIPTMPMVLPSSRNALLCPARASITNSTQTIKQYGFPYPTCVLDS
jgi:hypothetical protein